MTFPESLWVISRHDLDVIHEQIVRVRLSGWEPEEIVISSRRVREGLRVFGITVRQNDDLGLNEGLLVAQGREPFRFDFEEAKASA